MKVWTVFLASSSPGRMDAEARAAWAAAARRPPVLQRDAAPGNAAARFADVNAAPANAANPAGAPRACAPAHLPPRPPALGRHARRPGRRPRPGLAGAQRSASAPASANILMFALLALVIMAWSDGDAAPRAGHAEPRPALRLPGRDGGQRRCRRASTTRQGRQRRVRPALGAQHHRVRRKPRRRSLRGWRAHRLGPGNAGRRGGLAGLAEWGVPAGFDVPKASWRGQAQLRDAAGRLGPLRHERCAA
jgi:hypothetical protein